MSATKSKAIQETLRWLPAANTALESLKQADALDKDPLPTVGDCGHRTQAYQAEIKSRASAVFTALASGSFMSASSAARGCEFGTFLRVNLDGQVWKACIGCEAHDDEKESNT